MSKSIDIKQRNIVSLSCNVSQDITNKDISAALMLNDGSIVQCVTAHITATAFSIIIDATLLPVGRAEFDIKIDNVSSDTMIVNIIKAIA